MIPLRKNCDKSLLVHNQETLLAMVLPLFPPLIKGGIGDLPGVAADEILLNNLTQPLDID